MASSETVTECPSCGTKNRTPVHARGRPRCASCQADLPWLVDATDADFANAVRTKQLVLVDLWAPWCGPCQMIAPILKKLAVEFAGRLKVVKVNVDENPQTSMDYQAQSIPMMVFIQDGETVETVIGAHPERAVRFKVEQHLAASGG
jgi:thioredoxin 2